jgi:hypothetical protein
MAFPDSISGFARDGYESVRQAFMANFVRRRELGGACCAYRHGEKIVDLWVGSVTSRPGSRGNTARWSSCIRRRKVWPR